MACIPICQRLLEWYIKSLTNLVVKLDILEPRMIFDRVQSRSSLTKKIWVQHFYNIRLFILYDMVLSCEYKRDTIDSEGVLTFDRCIYVPNIDDLIQLFFHKAHISKN